MFKKQQQQQQQQQTAAAAVAKFEQEVPQFVQEPVESSGEQIKPKKRISHHTVEHLVDVPAPTAVEEVVQPVQLSSPGEVPQFAHEPVESSVVCEFAEHSPTGRCDDAGANPLTFLRRLSLQT